MTEEIIHIDNEDLVGIYGVNDENIQLLRKIFSQIKLIARGNELYIIGNKTKIEEFKSFFVRLQNIIQNTINLPTTTYCTSTKIKTNGTKQCWSQVIIKILFFTDVKGKLYEPALPIKYV